MNFIQNNPKSVYRRLNSAFHFCARYILLAAMRRALIFVCCSSTLEFRVIGAYHSVCGKLRANINASSWMQLWCRISFRYSFGTTSGKKKTRIQLQLWMKSCLSLHSFFTDGKINPFPYATAPLSVAILVRSLFILEIQRFVRRDES